MPTSDQLRLYGLRGGNVGYQDIVCTICLSPVNESVVTACQHVFCRLCLDSWLREHVSCPTSRNDLLKAREQLSTAQAMRSAASNQTRDPSPVHASGTLEQGLFGEAIREPPNPPVRTVPRSRVITFSTLSAQEVSDSQPQRSEYPTRPHDSLNYNTSTNDGVRRGFLQPNPPEHPAHSTIDDDISNDYSHESATVVLRQESHSRVVDSQRILGIMRAEANKLAYARGISQHQDYWQAARVVYKDWARVLGRKDGQSMLKYDLVWLLAEEMNLALAGATIVGLNRCEVMPQRLSKYLRDVARAGVDL